MPFDPSIHQKLTFKQKCVCVFMYMFVTTLSLIMI